MRMNNRVHRSLIIEELEPRFAPSFINYAVLFAGGGGVADNHVRYYNNIVNMYDTLVNDYHLQTNNVYVLFADGTNPAVDRSDGQNSDMTFASGSTVLSGTSANLGATLTTLAGIIDAQDHFLFYSFDHGGGTYNAPGTTGEEVLTGWGDSIADDVLDGWLGAINAGHSSYVFTQCYAGGMLDDLMPMAANNFGCAATNHYESSWGDGFANAFYEALDQGIGSTFAAYQYAYANDPFATDGEGPGGAAADNVEHPWKTGNDFPIFLQWSGEPTGLDLLPGSDTGIYNDDDVTQLDNSTGAHVLQFGVSGTVPGAIVDLYADLTTLIGTGVATGTTTVVTTNGTADLPDGLRYISATQTVSGGAVSGHSAGLYVTIDTTPPDPPSSLDLSPLSDTGMYDYDNITNDPTLLFTIHGNTDTYWRTYREDPTAPGTWLLESTPPILGDDLGVYKTGTWEELPDQTTAFGDGTFNYVTRAVDAAGNESTNSPILQVTIDTTAPNAPLLPDLQPASDSGIFNNDNYTNDFTPGFDILPGVQNPADQRGDYMRIYDLNTGHLKSDLWLHAIQFDPARGLYLAKVQLPAQFDGAHDFVARAVDEAGNVSLSSPALQVTIDTQRPNAPILIDLDASTDTGIYDTDNYTNSDQPRFNVTVADETQDYWQVWRQLIDTPETFLRVSTDGYVGDDVQVYRGSGNPFAPPWNPGSGYEFLFEHQPDSVDEFGRPIPYLYSARAVDIAGNVSADWSGAIPVIIDTVAPPALTLGDPRQDPTMPGGPAPDEPLDYISGTIEPIHTSWPTFRWPHAMIPSGPGLDEDYDPAVHDCYLATYWIRITDVDDATVVGEYDIRYETGPPPGWTGPGRPLVPGGAAPLPVGVWPYFIPQDTPGGSPLAPPGTVYSLSPTNPNYGNQGLDYGFHTWEILAEDLAGNISLETDGFTPRYSAPSTFLIDVFTEADGDIIRLDVDRATLRNAGSNQVLTVTSTLGTRPGTDFIERIDIAGTDDGSLLHWYLDPSSTGDGAFTVGHVVSGPGVSVGMISVGIPKDYTPTAAAWTAEGIGTFDTVTIGGSRLGALLISGNYDARPAGAANFVTVAGGTGELGWFRAENIVLIVPGGHPAIFTSNTKFIETPRGQIWDDSVGGTPLAPTTIPPTAWTNFTDDSGSILSMRPAGGTADVLAVPMANGGVVVAEVDLPGGTRTLKVLVGGPSGADITRVVSSTGSGFTKLQFSASPGMAGELDVLSIDSMGGNIRQVLNKTQGGDLFHIDAGAGVITSISVRRTGRIGMVYAGMTSRRVWPRHNPWPDPPAVPPVQVPFGVGEDYFRENGIIASRLGRAKTGKIDGANINIAGPIAHCLADAGVIDSRVTATSISAMIFKGPVENSSFTTTVGGLRSLSALDTISDSIFDIATELRVLNSRDGIIDTIIRCNSLRQMRVNGPFNGNEVNVWADAQRLLFRRGFHSSELSVGGRLLDVFINDGMSASEAAPSSISARGGLLKGTVRGNISQYSSIVVGAPGQESNLDRLNVLGLIYGDIMVYGDLVMLSQRGTAPTPAPPLLDFVEAYFFNDTLGDPTGGRVDVGGRAIRVL